MCPRRVADATSENRRSAKLRLKTVKKWGVLSITIDINAVVVTLLGRPRMTIWIGCGRALRAAPHFARALRRVCLEVHGRYVADPWPARSGVRSARMRRCRRPSVRPALVGPRARGYLDVDTRSAHASNARMPSASANSCRGGKRCQVTARLFRIRRRSGRGVRRGVDWPVKEALPHSW